MKYHTGYIPDLDPQYSQEDQNKVNGFDIAYMEGLDAMYGKGLDPNKYSKKEFQTYSQQLDVPQYSFGLNPPSRQ